MKSQTSVYARYVSAMTKCKHDGKSSCTPNNGWYIIASFSFMKSGGKSGECEDDRWRGRFLDSSRPCSGAAQNWWTSFVGVRGHFWWKRRKCGCGVGGIQTISANLQMCFYAEFYVSNNILQWFYIITLKRWSVMVNTDNSFGLCMWQVIWVVN